MRLLCAMLALAVLVPAQSLPTAPKAPKLGVLVYEDEHDGVVVDEVRPNTAAAKAGLKSGDRIVKIGGVAIKTDADLLRAMQGVHAGHTTTISVKRGEDSKSFPLIFDKPKPARVRSRDPDEARKALTEAEKALKEHGDLPAVKLALKHIAKAKKLLRSGRGGVIGGGAMPNMEEITDRVQELLQSGASQDEIQKAIAEEFPGVNIKIGGGLQELEEEPPVSDRESDQKKSDKSSTEKKSTGSKKTVGGGEQ